MNKDLKKNNNYKQKLNNNNNIIIENPSTIYVYYTFYLDFRE